MTQFIVDPSFWEVFPEAKIFTLAVENIDNHIDPAKNGEFKRLLRQAFEAAEDHVALSPFASNPVIAKWREAFTRFKKKKGVRSSIEALLKRVDKDSPLSPINPLVDIYNSISLTYAVPCGGEDIDKIEGDIHLGKAKGGEPFFPLGAEEDAPALPEEICYFDNEGAVCRCFNWREAERTMLTEETTRAALVIEAIDNESAKQAKEAIEALQKAIEDYFGVKGTIKVADKENPSHQLL